jgi:GAF domain-containing protein
MIDPRRAGRYERIYEQLKGLIEDKSPTLTAAMATINAVLHAKMRHHFWTGFYFLVSESEMHVGPYQGSVACQVLKDRGVCLHCANTKQAVVVPDVDKFPGHIPCDSRSKSEICIPVMKDSDVIAVLDVDSDKLAQFDDDDIPYLEKIIGLLEPYL